MPLKLQTKESIDKKLLKLYSRAEHLKSYLKGEPFEVNFSFKRLSSKDIEKNFDDINIWIKELSKLPFKIEFKLFSYRSLGEQSLPYSLTILEDEFLTYLDKREEFSLDVTLLDRTLSQFPTLKEVLLKSPKIVMDNRDIWERLLSVCNYLLTYPKPNLYIRELKIEGVDSKFIERNRGVLDRLLEVILESNMYHQEIDKIANYGFERKYGLKYDLPTIRFRILDRKLYINGLDDLSLPLNLFKNLNLNIKYIYITENKINGLTFPKRKDAIVIFGLGYGVDSLKDVEWLRDKTIYYWGDIDTHGFAILSRIRGYFPNTLSMLMDKETTLKFKHLAVIESKPFNGELNNLTEDENLLFFRLKNNYYGESLRIEQERIPFY